jgi:hypothetical protein
MLLDFDFACATFDWDTSYEELEKFMDMCRYENMKVDGDWHIVEMW